MRSAPQRERGRVGRDTYTHVAARKGAVIGPAGMKATAAPLDDARACCNVACNGFETDECRKCCTKELQWWPTGASASWRRICAAAKTFDCQHASSAPAIAEESGRRSAPREDDAKLGSNCRTIHELCVSLRTVVCGQMSRGVFLEADRAAV